MCQPGLYPKHTPLITHIKPCAVRIMVAGCDDEEFVFVPGGILEVQPNGVMAVTDTAIRGHDQDEATALAAKKLAEESIVYKEFKIDYVTVQTEFAPAIALLRPKNR